MERLARVALTSHKENDMADRDQTAARPVQDRGPAVDRSTAAPTTAAGETNAEDQPRADLPAPAHLEHGMDISK